MKNNRRESWDIIIEPTRGVFDLRLRQVLRYWDLLVLFVKRDIVVVYKQTILGPIWFFVQPIFTTIVYIVVFGSIAEIPTDGVPQPLFYLSGIVMWNYFSDCFFRNSDTFTHNAPIFGKVYFPRLISPLSIVVSSAIKFLIQFALFGIVLGYYFWHGADIAIKTELLFFPVIFLIMAAISLGFGLFFSALTTKYKDLKFLIHFGVQLAMYASPVIYPMSVLSEPMRNVMWWNPLSHLLEAVKYMFLGAGSFSYVGLGFSALFGGAVLMLGVVVFNYRERSFMDTV